MCGGAPYTMIFSTMNGKYLIMQHEKFHTYTLKLNTIFWRCKKIRLLLNKGVYNETERSPGWLPWSSLDTLKASFNVASDDQDSHRNVLSVSVYRTHSPLGAAADNDSQSFWTRLV